MNTSSDHPVLLIHPDREEAEYLRSHLHAEHVAHPIVVLPDSTAAKDYLNAVLIADLVEKRYRPCVVLLDEKLGEAEVRSLTQWLREQPALRCIRIAALSDGDSPGAKPGADSWGADEAVTTNDQLHALAGFITRECN